MFKIQLSSTFERSMFLGKFYKRNAQVWSLTFESLRHEHIRRYSDQRLLNSFNIAFDFLDHCLRDVDNIFDSCVGIHL